MTGQSVNIRQHVRGDERLVAKTLGSAHLNLSWGDEEGVHSNASRPCPAQHGAVGFSTLPLAKAVFFFPGVTPAGVIHCAALDAVLMGYLSGWLQWVGLGCGGHHYHRRCRPLERD